MILNERILQVVLALSEELHFGRAAARLFVSQPALSGTIKTLESDLGVRLFRRTSRHVELTEAGRVFAAEARRLIEEGQRAISLIRGSSPDIVGPLRIGYLSSMDLGWVCSLISCTRKEGRQGADLQFVSSDAPHVPEDLVRRTLHAAFYAGQLCHPDLECTALFREPYMAVLGSGHRYADMPLVRLEQLADEPVVWLRRELNPLHYDGFMALCAAHGYRPRIVQEVSTYRECQEFARAELGITFLPSFMQADCADESVAFVPLTAGALYAEYGVAYPRNTASRDVERFVKFAQQHAAHKHASPQVQRIDRPA